MMGKRSWTPNKQAVLDAVKSHPGSNAATIATHACVATSNAGDILYELRSYWQLVECQKNGYSVLWYSTAATNSTIYKKWKISARCEKSKIVVDVVEFATGKVTGSFNYLYSDAKNASIAIKKVMVLLDAIASLE